MAVDGRSAVTISLEGPQQQRRWTVALRLILAIPHFFWFSLLSIVVFFAVIAAWFAALVTARMPRGLGDFIARVLQYQTCLYAYMYLLTDRYPPFTLSPVDAYPAELEIAEPDRLNRAAVLFRIILLIPAAFVSSLVSGGATIVLFFLWIITLVSGRMPDSAFEALAVTLRYQLRLYAYGSMLTSEYPGGVFGDKVGAPSAPPIFDAGAAPLTPQTPLAPAGPPRITRFVLSTAAKRLVVLFIVLGVVTNAASAKRFPDLTERRNTADRLQSEHKQLEAAITTYLAEVQSCAATGDRACTLATIGRFRDALRSFQLDVRGIDVPARAEDDKTLLDIDATEMIKVLELMQEAGSITDINDLVARLTEVGNRFDRDYQRLYDDTLFG